MSTDLIVRAYSADEAEEWDRFVTDSRNGTFLLKRQYMDYHADRFEDASLWIERSDGRPLAILPANRDGSRIDSHGGLTYGGLVLADGARAAEVIACFSALVESLLKGGFETLRYKTIPGIYHRQPAEDDRYPLFLLGAELCRRDLLSVDDLRNPGPIQQRRKRGAKKALKAGVSIAPDDRLGEFWPLLETVLSDRHEAAPVHRLEEIALLAGRFPENIQLWTARSEGTILAGTVLYIDSETVHAQYIAANDDGRQLGALDLLFSTLITHFSPSHRFFDFGISNEDGGRKLNRGLIQFKEGFGARSTAHDHYLLDLTAARLDRLLAALA